MILVTLFHQSILLFRRCVVHKQILLQGFSAVCRSCFNFGICCIDAFSERMVTYQREPDSSRSHDSMVVRLCPEPGKIVIAKIIVTVEYHYRMMWIVFC